MTPLEVLTKVRGIIVDPAWWTVGAYARDADGNSVSTSSKSAVCFCVVGAIRHVAHCVPGAVEDLLSEAASTKFPNAVGVDEASWVFVNDNFGHEATIQMLDYAIELAKVAA